MLADWDERMSVGVDALDAHHRQVWRRVRHLANAVSDGGADEVRASLRLLLGYLVDHDPEEERWMEDAGYPGAREHARAHAAVRERLAAARDDVREGAARRLLETAEWVVQALGQHHRGDDLRLARFVTARENLRRLAEAGPGVGVALTPVPGSLAAVNAGGAAERPARTPAPVPFPTPVPRRR
jgi:hemerythrin